MWGGTPLPFLKYFSFYPPLPTLKGGDIRLYTAIYGYIQLDTVIWKKGLVCGIMMKYYNPLDFIISTSMLRENSMFIPWKMWYPIFRHSPHTNPNIYMYIQISSWYIIISSLEQIAQTQHKLHIACTWRFFAHAARSAAALAIGGSRDCLDFGTVVFFSMFTYRSC